MLCGLTAAVLWLFRGTSAADEVLPFNCAYYKDRVDYSSAHSLLILMPNSENQREIENKARSCLINIRSCSDLDARKFHHFLEL